MAKPAMLFKETSLTMFYEGKTYNIGSDHENWSLIKKTIKENDLNDSQTVSRLISLFGVINPLALNTSQEFKIVNDVVYYRDEPLHNSLTKRLVSMLKEGFDVKPLENFLVNLMENSSKRSIDELYTFLECNNLPITEDGHFLAYKAVRNDFKDYYSGTIDNSVGRIVTMPRNKVDDDQNRTCSYGLHFCSIEYIKHFLNRGGNVVILKINPKNVVAIPTDYNNTKGRCCEYEVIGIYENFVNDVDLFKKPVYNSDDLGQYDFTVTFEGEEEDFFDYDVFEEDDEYSEVEEFDVNEYVENYLDTLTIDNPYEDFTPEYFDFVQGYTTYKNSYYQTDNFSSEAEKIGYFVAVFDDHNEQEPYLKYENLENLAPFDKNNFKVETKEWINGYRCGWNILLHDKIDIFSSAAFNLGFTQGKEVLLSF